MSFPDMIEKVVKDPRTMKLIVVIARVFLLMFLNIRFIL